MMGFRFVVDVILILGGIATIFLMLPKKRPKTQSDEIPYATYEVNRTTHRHGIPDEDDQDLETIKRKMHDAKMRGE